jgi:hypothetical protein
MFRLATIFVAMVFWATSFAQQTACKSHYNKALKKTIFTQVSEEPMFPGGASAKMRFITKTLKLPEHDIDDNILQSSVIVKLIIDADGTIRQSAIDKKNNRDLTLIDKEVLRVVGLMPKWIPGKCNGEAVAVEITFPVIICYSEE